MNCRNSTRPILSAFSVALISFSVCVDAREPDFESEILPILQRSCYGCHGPDEQKSSYRLDIRETAFRGGVSRNAAIVPHDALASPLIQRVTHADPDERMPPPESDGPALSSREIELLKAWIDAGPVWPDAFAGDSNNKEPHWSLRPLDAPPMPNFAQHPVDAFLLEKLNTAGIAPSPQTDKTTLLRRVYIDLTGLPPSPEALDAFLADSDPLAYERVVDSLLTSPRYGERWARHWLDTIHFADSHGYEHDIARDNAWRYRDYVIEALNNDTPWPRFIREQLAADYFWPDETSLTPALGFLGAGNFDLSTYITAGVTFDYLDRDDVVTQTTGAFLGATANCARCHDHKFDPIPQEDYYALQAVFSGMLKGDVAYDADPAVARSRRMWTTLLADIERGDKADLRSPENVARVHEWQRQYGNGADWTLLAIETFLSTEGAALTLDDDAIVSVSGPRPDADTYTITASTSLKSITAFRLEVLAHDDLPMGGPGRAENGNLTLSGFEVQLFEPGASSPKPVHIRGAYADFNQTDWEITKAIDGNAKTGWGIHPEEGKTHVAVFELDEAIQLSPATRIAFSLKQEHGEAHLIGAFRLLATSDDVASAVPFSEAAIASRTAEGTDEHSLETAAAILRHSAEHSLDHLPEQAVVYAAAHSVDIPNGEVAANIATLDTPKPVHLMIRGDFESPAEEIGPGALSALTHMPARFAIEHPDKEAERRAAMADWIAHPGNVLTWRCIVNRVWHAHFGRGISDTPSDLGRMGGDPTHPELLDWLAVWFRDDANGSLRELHRLIVTSAAYQQSSAIRADALVIDSDNQLLWRQNAQRLDAGAYRDSVLAVSGSLDLTMGGPADRYFIESPGPQLTPALDYAAYDWRGAEQSRRSIYRFVWRGIPDPLLDALDFPDLGLLSPTRTESVSSLQALALYNNDFVLAHCEALAQRVEHEAKSIDDQVSRAVRLVWLRETTDDERKSFAQFVQNHGMTAFCRILLNSNEFLFLD